MPLTQFEKDPDATLDFAIDWSDAFPGDDLTAATATVDDAALVVENESHTATVHTVRLSGGAVGRRYEVTSTVTTTSGQSDQRTVEVVVLEK